MNANSQQKREVDQTIHNMLLERDPEADPIPNWTPHDLRRTARSLMSRTGVKPHVAERVLGHAIAGVEGVYDRYEYADEKAEALERLTGLVEQIVNPPKGRNVVPIRQA